MKNKLLVLIALVVAVTAFGIDPSHARRIRFSMPAAKAAPAAAKPAPVAAAARQDSGVARPHFFVTPGVAIRPPNGPAAAATPMAISAPMAAGTPGAAIGEAAALMGTGMPSVDKALADATKREEPPAPPAQRHFVDLTPDPPRSPREIGPSPPQRANVTLCYKTATGQCGNL
jgi:hypothetical protein